jgi:hypothetical protein
MFSDEFTIENAQYFNDFEGNKIGIRADINGRDTHVPINLDNRHYAKIMELVKAGELTIANKE